MFLAFDLVLDVKNKTKLRTALYIGRQNRNFYVSRVKYRSDKTTENKKRQHVQFSIKVQYLYTY